MTFSSYDALSTRWRGTCAADGRHTMFLCSAPLNIPGGYGSPADVLALK
jgi:hypothetical protein